MVSPRRVRVLYYLVEGVCYSVVLFLMWHFSVGRSFGDGQHLLWTLALAFPQVIPVLVCRAMGYSLARRTETRLGDSREPFAAGTAEVRSYSSRDVFKAVVWACLALLGADVFLLLLAWVRVHFYGAYSYRYQLEHWYFVPCL